MSTGELSYKTQSLGRALGSQVCAHQIHASCIRLRTHAKKVRNRFGRQSPGQQEHAEIVVSVGIGGVKTQDGSEFLLGEIEVLLR